MYQPLKGQALNSRPPISSSILDTAGRPYHFRPRSLNQSNLGESGSPAQHGARCTNEERGDILSLGWLIWGTDWVYVWTGFCARLGPENMHLQHRVPLRFRWTSRVWNHCPRLLLVYQTYPRVSLEKVCRPHSSAAHRISLCPRAFT